MWRQSLCEVAAPRLRFAWRRKHILRRGQDGQYAHAAVLTVVGRGFGFAVGGCSPNTTSEPHHCVEAAARTRVGADDRAVLHRISLQIFRSAGHDLLMLLDDLDPISLVVAVPFPTIGSEGLPLDFPVRVVDYVLGALRQQNPVLPQHHVEQNSVSKRHLHVDQVGVAVYIRGAEKAAGAFSRQLVFVLFAGSGFQEPFVRSDPAKLDGRMLACVVHIFLRRIRLIWMRARIR
mmetsp:Transcript_13845/g.34133  ORF Transcript_13845/g.34133 Transcript_13845/m.34133 type:complete len:233 (+) Transcript_13845:3778-4476(+)